MSNLITHPYHLVDESPWPLQSAIFALGLTSGMAKWFHNNSMFLFSYSFLFLLLVMFQWWRDICREATFMGFHSSVVSLGMKWGMILFIISEVFFFLSFFWAFFHSALSPNMEMGGIWPPIGVFPFNAMGVPLLNTLILISSGISVTWSHLAIVNNNHSQTFLALSMTIILGLYFTMIQSMEYMEASFTIADSVYGSSFFIATGFHGLHVIIGTIFLMTCLLRLYEGMFSYTHHFGFQAAIWYWHFVDVIWLFLYFTIYTWGGI